MGMAASQARFLGLTARKTNIEFEGQQVNQQRMALGSQTASYYTQLLGFGVPTPPSIDQFTKMVYSWKPVSGSANTILQMIPKTDNSGKYVVRYSWQEEVTAADKKGETTITKNTANKYLLGTQELQESITEPTDKLDKEEWKAVQKLLYMSDDSRPEADKNDTKFNTWYSSAAPVDKKYELYTYKDKTTVGSVNIYLTAEQVEKATGTTPEASAKAMQYKVGQITQNKENTTDATLRFDEAGRPIGIKPEDSTEEMSLSASSIKDEIGYDTAMNKYEMEKFQYSKNMEDMNAKIKIMQEQDRSLELRLKQLDTEQKAVSTEMEAVSKIIQKNVESTFKTFG